MLKLDSMNCCSQLYTMDCCSSLLHDGTPYHMYKPYHAPCGRQFCDGIPTMLQRSLCSTLHITSLPQGLTLRLAHAPSSTLLLLLKVLLIYIVFFFKNKINKVEQELQVKGMWSSLRYNRPRVKDFM